MEILLKAGDRINIPTGCVATIVDNEIIIESDFKDGDFLVSTDGECFAIFWKTHIVAGYEEFNDSFDAHYCSDDDDDDDLIGFNKTFFRHATEEEKQKIHEDLKSKGLYWDDEAKVVKGIKIVKDKEPIVSKPIGNFKDGDILCMADRRIFVVFESYEVDNDNYTFCSHYNTAGEDNKRWVPQYFHVASIREQQLFFKKLEERGLIWNANTRRVHKL